MYRFLIIPFLLCLCAFDCVRITEFEQSGNAGDEIWDSETEIRHLENRQDPSAWDYDILAGDIEQNNEDAAMQPFRYGAFPVPKYDLLGESSFNGMGFGSKDREFGRKGNSLIYSFFFVNRNKFTDRYLAADKPNEVFFTIVVLSDIAIDTLNYSHLENHVISRNHPDYIGQGSIRTKGDRIDYMAFLTADRDEYAVVNMRLFNLKHGRTVLIAPQKDGSLRSMQLKSEQFLSSHDIETYMDELLMQQSVKNFFTN